MIPGTALQVAATTLKEYTVTMVIIDTEDTDTEVMGTMVKEDIAGKKMKSQKHLSNQRKTQSPALGSRVTKTERGW